MQVWSLTVQLAAAARLRDALLAKRLAYEYARIAHSLPNMARWAGHAKGLYLLLRGRPREAIPLLDTEKLPETELGWVRARGWLAAAYNELGEHARAHDVCLEATTGLLPADDAYVGFTLGVKVELVKAEAALGNIEVARAGIARLIAIHAPNQGAVTLATLHEAAASVALVARDFSAARAYLAQMRGWLAGVEAPGLRERMHVAERVLSHAEGGDREPDLLEPQLLRARLAAAAARAARPALGGRAQAVLAIALELSQADAGGIVLRGETALAQAATPLEVTALVEWAATRLAAGDDDETTQMLEGNDERADPNRCVLGGKHYVASPLWGTHEGKKCVIAVLAMGRAGALPVSPSPLTLRVFEQFLDDPGTTTLGMMKAEG